MFRPNAVCRVYAVAGYNAYAEPVLGAPRDVGCTVLSLKQAVAPTSSRQALSASGEGAEDVKWTASLMIERGTSIAIGSKVVVRGQELRVSSVNPVYTTFGHLDHYTVEGAEWA